MLADRRAAIPSQVEPECLCQLLPAKSGSCGVRRSKFFEELKFFKQEIVLRSLGYSNGHHISG